jgi:hypothetical protein
MSPAATYLFPPLRLFPGGLRACPYACTYLQFSIRMIGSVGSSQPKKDCYAASGPASIASRGV